MRDTGFLKGIRDTVKNSFDVRQKRFKAEKKKGVFNQISTLDISSIFKSLDGWAKGSSPDIEISINDVFKCLHIKKLAGDQWSEFRYVFDSPLPISNNAKYLRFWINIPDVSKLSNIDFYINSNNFGGTHRQNILAADLVTGSQYIDLPIDRLQLQGSGSTDIYKAGIDRFRFLVKAIDTTTEADFSIDRMEFIERKPFFLFFMDDAKEENTEDVSPYLISKNMPWTVSMPPRNFERWNNNAENPGANITSLSVVKDLVNNHNMFCGVHFNSLAFPEIEITQSGGSTSPEITKFNFYSADVFVLEETKSHVDRHAGKYFLVSSPSTDYYVWFNKDSGSADPAVADRTGIEVAIATGDSVDDIGTKASTAIEAVVDFTASYADRSITVTNANNGAVSAPDVGTCPWGIVGFRECHREAYEIGLRMGLFSKNYIYNAWGQNRALNKERNRVGRAYSSILRSTNDSPSSVTASSANPSFEQGDSPVAAINFRYINQFSNLHSMSYTNLDTGYSAEQIGNLFEKMIKEQVQITVYTHGSQRNQIDTRTPIETLEAFFRVYGDYRSRIDCLSVKDITDMYNEVEIIRNPQNEVGGDSVFTMLSYRIKDDDVVI